VFASVLLPKISGIVPRSNSISYGYVDVTILEEKLVGQFWDIGLVLIGEFFEGSHSPPLWLPFRSHNWYQSRLESPLTLIGFVINYCDL